ncbi:hypothetical protein LXL04_025170 [Taraxacum kok-saghyz]
MDRETWMYRLDRFSQEYLDNLLEFEKAANDHRVHRGKSHIWCPCTKCQNCQKFDDWHIIQGHLITEGFMSRYTRWSEHGELLSDGITVDVGSNYDDVNDSEDDNHDNLDQMLDDIEDDGTYTDYENFQQLIEENEKPLYEGCKKFTKLSAVLKLFNLKANNGRSDKSFTKTLEVINEMPPEDAKLVRWHAEERKRDGKMRHVADSPKWRNIDHEFEEFGDEIRNIRFRLSADGINPFKNMSSRHSTWPVLLCIYNLPPWLSMKRKYIMMSLLIQGPKQPGQDIYVFLAPLIEHMKKLRNSGVEVYDAYKKEHFQLRAMIYCTISDFPAYADLSGYSTKGKKACPVCEENTQFRRLKNCNKHVYMGHRRSLPKKHLYRTRGNLSDGEDEKEEMAPPMDGKTTFSRVQNLEVVFGKCSKNNQLNNWKKRSILIGDNWMNRVSL